MPENNTRSGDYSEQPRQCLPPGVQLMGALRGHTNWIGRLAWSPDGRLLASASRDMTVRLWNAATAECVHVLADHQMPIIGVAFDATGKKVATGGDDRRIRIWDAATGVVLQRIDEQRATMISLAFHPAAALLASGSDDRTIKLWDAETGHHLTTLQTHWATVTALAFRPSDGLLAMGGDDGSVHLVSHETGTRVRSMEGHSKAVRGVAFDPSGRTLATGSADGTVRIWDADDGRSKWALEGHTGEVTDVSFSFDGALLASRGGSLDPCVRLWRTDTGNCVAVIQGAAGTPVLPGIAFHPHLPILATVASEPAVPEWQRDRIISLYRYEAKALVGQAYTPTVTYTSAKIVLVGESCVGKSYLAHRIATGLPPEAGTIHSTHGMKFWPLEPEKLSPAAIPMDGQLRDIVLWDMGGQDEYRLVHQLFLHDTTVALVLLDPTRGRTAFEEVEAWDKRLEKQLHGRPATKLLVGAKLDHPSTMVDVQELERLKTQCGFVSFHETSALTGRGIDELRQAMASAIDWDGLGKTSRPELFQRIRDEIEARRSRSEVVLEVAELYRSVGSASANEAETRAVDAVVEQLCHQGVIARSRVASGEPTLVLQVQEIERYAGSIILAARGNQRGVPAIELRGLARRDFAFPGMSDSERLAAEHERPVLECTVELLIEHGICFEHEGLLVFPSLFSSARDTTENELQQAVSLYYDFSGAIDNIYASLVAWLVLARDFGRVRLWADRAEFETVEGSTCGVRKVTRAGGFAHADVYFDPQTPSERRRVFISFVEEHLRRHGVEILEHVAITCTCGEPLEEETVRKRIAKGKTDVICPVCEKRHELAEGAAESRVNNPGLDQSTWALKTEIGKRRLQSAEQVMRVMERASEAVQEGPVRLLHLSDLHFGKDTSVRACLKSLVDDLKIDLHCGLLDYLVVTGDFTDRGSSDGWEKAYDFLANLIGEFGLSAERCLLVPGNHDVSDVAEAFELAEDITGQSVRIRSAAHYGARFRPFSSFFHKLLVRPYPLDPMSQGIATPYWETGLQFICLNSSWQIDEFDRERSGVHDEALANALFVADEQLTLAHEAQQRTQDSPLLRIGVWHHPVKGPKPIKKTEFLGNLQKAGVRLALHGDSHEILRDVCQPLRMEPPIHVVGAGAFAASADARPESTPRLYNLLEIRRDLKHIRIHTRCQPDAAGPWKGWNEWPNPDGAGAVPYYDIGI